MLTSSFQESTRLVCLNGVPLIFTLSRKLIKLFFRIEDRCIIFFKALPRYRKPLLRRDKFCGGPNGLASHVVIRQRNQ